MHPRLLPSEVTDNQLMAWANAGGVRITRAQLVRWHKAELIPQPRRRHLGYGRGTESLYPPIAQFQVLSVVKALRITRNFQEVRWILWHVGYPHLNESVRKDLLAGLVDAEKTLRRGLDSFRQRVSGNPIEAFGTTARPPKGFGRVRRRVGKGVAETMSLMMHELMLGEFRNAKYDKEDFMFARAAIATSLYDKKDPSVDVEVMTEGLTLASRELNLTAFQEALKAVPVQVLVRIRDEASAFWRPMYPMLPAGSASIPPQEIFLLWFGFRHVSPTLAPLSKQLSIQPGFRRPEFPPLAKLKLNLLALEASNTSDRTRPKKKNKKKSNTKNRRPRS